MGLSDNEARFNFGYDQDMGRPGFDVYEEALVVMSLRTAKLFSYTLSKLISNFEAANGEIPISSEMYQRIDRSLGAVGSPPPQK
jgi:hypothetical protein